MKPSPAEAHRVPATRLLRAVGTLLVLFGALLSTALPAGAAGWSAPADVPDGPSGEPPTVAARSGATAATAADGTTWVAWVQTTSFASGPVDRLRVAQRAPDGAWSPPVDVVSAPRASGHTATKIHWPAIEVGPAGRPVLLWGQVKPGAAQADNVFDAFAATLDGSGSWSAPHPLGDATYGAGSAYNGSFVVHRLRSGAVAAVWRSSATGVRAAVLGVDSSWSAPTELTSTASGSQREVDIAADLSDRVTVIWSDAAGVSTATRSESGAWGAPQVVDATTTSGSAPHIAADADGFLVATWSPTANAVRTAHRTGGQATWSVDTTAVRGETRQLAPDVAFDDHGRATLAWGETTFAADDTTADGGRIRARMLGPDRQWTAPKTVAALADANRPSAPRVLASANGTTIVWTDAVSTQSPRYARLSAATRRDGEPWGPLTPLTDSANGFLRVPDGLRADALGNVTIAITPLMSAVQANATPVQIRDLRPAPPAFTRWSARWVPGTLNLRTFLNYLSSDPAGGAFPSDGADRPEPLDRYGFRLTPTDAWRDAATGETVLEHRGTLRLAMPSHFIDIRIVDPTFRIASDGGSARVIADGRGSGEMDMGVTEQKVDPFEKAHLLSLDLRGAGPRLSGDGGTRTWVAARARIAPGLASRYLTYGEGSLYGDFTFSVPVDVETRHPDPEDPPGDPGDPGHRGDQGDPPPTPWTPPAGPKIVVPPASSDHTTRSTTVSGRLKGNRKPKRRATIMLSKRIGAKSTTTYRVKLTKGRKTVATGTLRNRTLKLVVRNTAGKGRKAKYVRLRGSYRLQANVAVSKGKAARIATTAVTIK